MWERGHISRSSRSTSGAGRAEHTRSQADRASACVGPARLSDRERKRGGGEHVCLGVGGRRRKKAISPTTTLPSLSLSPRKVSPPTFSPHSLYILPESQPSSGALSSLLLFLMYGEASPRKALSYSRRKWTAARSICNAHVALS